MSATDGDVLAGLDRAAQQLQVPGDPVAKVRARVQQRRRRRAAVRAGSVSTAAVALLVAGVSLGPGQVLSDAAPPAGTPSPGTGEEAGTLLSPDGLPGLALGSAPDADGYEADLRQTGSGCDGLQTQEIYEKALGSPAMGATEVIAWLRDEVVVAITVTAFPNRVEVPGDVPRTWLGPTLRSPIATALDLPGARLVKDDPLGDAGPPVTNVVVDVGDGVELVLTDLPVDDQPSQGRITSLVLRTEAGRDCRLVPGEDVVLPGQGVPGQQGSIALTARGTEDVQLGTPVALAEAAGVVTLEPDALGDPLDGRGCTTYRETATGLEVWADGGTVVAVGEDGLGGPRFTLTADLDITSGDPMAELGAVPGTTPVRVPPEASGFGTAVDVSVAPGVRARVVGSRPLVTAETTGLLLPGPPLVDGVVLYLGDEPADSLCTP